jgi:hypothetical protein
MKITVHSYVVRQVELQEKIRFLSVQPDLDQFGFVVVETSSEYLISELQKAEEIYMRPSVKR